MKIISGKIQKAQKVVIYGPEGIGKSTFASHFPDPLFCDTEGSTNNMDVNRTEKPTSWELLKQQIEEVKRDKPCKTFIIDTFDWAEQLCIDDLCARHQKSGIEDFGYGNGYVYEKEEIGRFLNKLEELIDVGINVVLTCHAQLRKFEQPDEMGAYDRWELKLGKKTSSQISPLVKEWADMVLFANYKTYAVSTDKEGKKFKAQGGNRVMYTTHHPCWDAKNRFNLPDEVAFDYEVIRHCIEHNSINRQAVQENQTQYTQNPHINQTVAQQNDEHSIQQLKPQQVVEQSTVQINPNDYVDVDDMLDKYPIDNGQVSTQNQMEDLSNIPKALADLMIANNVTKFDIQCAVSDKGYYPRETPIENYDIGFINGVLVGAWPQVYAMILENNKVPFDMNK